jgi:hypothetical protein
MATDEQRPEDASRGIRLTEEQVRQGAELPPQALAALLNGLADLPQISFVVNFIGDRTTEALLFIETWAPAEDGAGTRQRWLDQLQAVLAAEVRAGVPELHMAIGALAIAVRDGRARGDELAGLLREALTLLEATSVSFGQVLAIAARLDDPELQAWAAGAMAQFHVVDEDDEPTTAGETDDGS